MNFGNWLLVIIFSIANFLYYQFCAGGHIGNRMYSTWYETHFLVTKKGLGRFIYFKPKHFGRYTLYEASCFVISFLSIIVIITFAILRTLNIITWNSLLLIMFCPFGVMFLIEFAICVINDIGHNLDEKKRFYMEAGEREASAYPANTPVDIIEGSLNSLSKRVMKVYANDRFNEYFTIYNLYDSYYSAIASKKGDKTKIEQVNVEYINYFRNIEKLVVVKECKNGVLKLKIKK